MLELASPNTELPRGCLIVNAITERTNDPAKLDIVKRHINHVEDALRKALTRARASGEIPAASSPRQLARFLVVVLQGLHVYDLRWPNPDEPATRSRSPCQLYAPALSLRATPEGAAQLGRRQR